MGGGGGRRTQGSGPEILLKLSVLRRWISPVVTKCAPYHPETLSNCQEMFCAPLGTRGARLWVFESSLQRIPASPVGPGQIQLDSNSQASPSLDPARSGEVTDFSKFAHFYRTKKETYIYLEYFFEKLSL